MYNYINILSRWLIAAQSSNNRAYGASEAQIVCAKR